MTEILKPKTAGNINDWANALEKDSPKLSKNLGEDRNIGIENLEKLGLPRYKNNKLSLIEFLENPQSGIKNLGTTHFTVGINPHDPKLARYNNFNITLEQTINFIKEKVAEEQRENYDIIIGQYFNNLYGGNIIVAGNQRDVLAEFKKGSQTDIARGKVDTKKEELFRVVSKPGTDTFHYSFTDEKLIKLFEEAMLSIPHWREEGLNFSPGYYEVIFAKDDNGEEKVLFIDCRIDPAFRSLPPLEGIRKELTSTVKRMREKK